MWTTGPGGYEFGNLKPQIEEARQRRLQTWRNLAILVGGLVIVFLLAALGIVLGTSATAVFLMSE